MNIFSLAFFCVRFTALEINVFFEFIYGFFFAIFACFLYHSPSPVACHHFEFVGSTQSLIESMVPAAIVTFTSFTFISLCMCVCVCCACDTMVNVLEFFRASKRERKRKWLALPPKKASRKNIKTKTKKRRRKKRCLIVCAISLCIYRHKLCYSCC